MEQVREQLSGPLLEELVPHLEHMREVQLSQMPRRYIVKP